MQEPTPAQKIEATAAQVSELVSKVMKQLMPKNEEDNASELYKAARDGKLKTVIRLIKEGADVNIALPSGKTPLYVAAEKGHKRITHALLKAGANVNPEMPFSKLANDWWDLTYHDDFHTVRETLKKKELHIISPLCAAIAGGHHQIMRQLLMCGANVNGLSPLAIAFKKQTNTTRYLHENFSHTQLSPMHIAAAKDDVDAMKLLIEFGGKIDYSIGVWVGYYQTYIFCVNIPKRFYSYTPLHAAAEAGAVHAAKFLLDQGANVNQRGYIHQLGIYTSEGDTPLHFAAEAGHNNVVELLITRGANVNAENWGITPLHKAAAKNKVRTIEVLLSHGAKIDEPSFYPPLEAAESCNHVEAMQVLLDHNATVTEKMFESAKWYKSINAKKSSQKMLTRAYHLQHTDLSDNGSFKRNEAITTLKSIDDEDKFNKALAIFKQITALDSIAEKNADTSHPDGRFTLTTYSIITIVDKAYTEFVKDPVNPTIISTLHEQAKEVSQDFKIAHARDGFFGRHGMTKCDVHKAIEKTLPPTMRNT